MTTLTQPLDVAAIRRHFPALAGEMIFLENAGGSQVPRCVADAIHKYMLNTYVQLGAGYDLSNRCTETVERAHRFINRFMHGEQIGSVALGPSTSILCQTLAQAYEPTLSGGDEIILAETGHESNVGPWVRLAERRGDITLRWWPFDPAAGDLSLDGLKPLLNDRTKIVAYPHVSNLLGGIVDVAAVSALCRSVGAHSVVDGVAFAPHRAIDVTAFDCDWYVYSAYKVYGPHMAALFGRSEAFAPLAGPNHFFIPPSAVPYKFELGGVNHEGCAGLLALAGYLNQLVGVEAESEGDVGISRETIERAFARMTELELPLQGRLMEYLTARSDVTIIGPRDAGEGRIGTISFVRPGQTSREIASRVNEQGIGIRHGHMYAHRLCSALGIDPEDGVVRISLVHYNTMDEIERLIAALDGAMR